MRNSVDRRDKIKKILEESKDALKGIELGKLFGVSRQVIVQDISILRAEGEEIIATPNGYIIFKNNGILKTIVCRHHGKDAIRDELETVIKYGGKILDVIVEHSIYGEVKGNLNINTKNEIKEFMKKLTDENYEPLCSITDGLHIHTIEVTNEESFQNIKNELLDKGYLVQ
ncbi:MAG: transcription repressor NadR [Sebaldella sp.]|nr:transcription repressor NadR [Sebaldella sp.]